MIHKFFLFFLLANFSLFSKSDTTLIKRHFNKIIDTQHPRNYLHPNTLDTVATYLENEFNKYADTVYFQPYMVNGKKYGSKYGKNGNIFEVHFLSPFEVIWQQVNLKKNKNSFTK